MAILLNDSLDVAAAKPTDNRYGPYATTALVLSTILPFQRYIGLVVGVITTGILSEYWFKNGILDGDLILKGDIGASGFSGYSGAGVSGFSGYSGAGVSGFSGYSGTGTSGFSGYSGAGVSGFSGYSGTSGFSGRSGFSGYSGTGTSGFSGYSGAGGSGFSGYSGTGTSGFSGYSGAGVSGFSGYSGAGGSGFSGYSGTTGTSGFSGISGLDGDRYHTTSTTSFTIGTSGSFTVYTVDLHLDYSTAQTIILAYDATNHQHASVSAYNKTTGQLDLVRTSAEGSGTYSLWEINLDGSVGIQGVSGFSGYSGAGGSGFSGYSGIGTSGFSGYSGIGTSGFSGYSGAGGSGFSGYSGIGTSGFSGYSGAGVSGFSGYSGSGGSGFSGYSGTTGTSGFSGYSGVGTSGFSGYSGVSGLTGNTGIHVGVTAPTDLSLLWLDESDPSGVGVYGIPPGGSSGQALTKSSSTSYDVGWTSIAGGSPNLRFVTVSNSLSTSDDIIIANATSNITLTLPVTSTIKQYYIKNISESNNLITLTGIYNEPIDGKANITILFKNSALSLIPAGNAWSIF